MGDPKRQRKKFESPRHPWREGTLTEELNLLGLYGLRNKRELWRHKTALSQYRKIARSLLGISTEKRSKREGELLSKLRTLGLIKENSTLDDVLDLVVQDLLERRLQTQVLRAGLTSSFQQSRQFIAHGHINIGEKKTTAPGYLVRKGEDGSIRYNPDSPLNNTEHPLRKIAAQASSPKESGV